MSDPRRVPLWSRLWPKLAITAIAAAPVLLWMNIDYDRSREHHSPSENNPISTAVDALQKTSDYAGNAYSGVMKQSRKIVAEFRGDPDPETVEPTRTLPQRDIPERRYTRPQTYNPRSAVITVCVPNELVDAWDHTETSAKMSAFKDLMATFVKAHGRPGYEYFVQNFDQYQPGDTDGNQFVDEVGASAGCPSGYQPYNITVPPGLK